MKTLLFRDRLDLDDLAMVDRPLPSPGPNEILVRVRAVSLNYRDLAIARGEYAGYGVPLVPCSDGAGDVVAVGECVRRFVVGDRVCLAYVPDWIEGPVRAETSRRRLGGPTDGVLSEYVCSHEEAAVHVPSGWSFIEASTLPVAGVTAWQALVEEAKLGAGQVIGVSGTGGVSLFALQIAQMLGARAIVVGRDAAKLDRVAALGASTVSSATGVAWEREVLALTGGGGVDLFVDVVGGQAVARSIAATRVGGTVCSVGFVGGTTAPIDLISLIRRAVTLRATSGGNRTSFERLVRAYERTPTRPFVDRVFAFGANEVRHAMHHLAQGRPFGKVAIAIEQAP